MSSKKRVAANAFLQNWLSGSVKKLKSDTEIANTENEKENAGTDNCSVDPDVEDIRPRRRREELPAAKRNSLNFLNTSVDFLQFRPSSTFEFPKSKTNRQCNHKWFEIFKWLHYSSITDAVYCSICISAIRKRIVSQEDFKKTSFISEGFSSWNKANERFKGHETCEMHIKCINRLMSSQTVEPISLSFDKALLREQQTARNCLHLIITGIKYLCRTGQALRGHNAFQGNLMLFLEELESYTPEIRQWIERRNNWLSSEIQNEIVEIMAHTLQRRLIDRIVKSTYFGIIADGTTDISGKEQFSLCIRVVNKKLEIEETFYGLYNAPDSKGVTLTEIIKDMLLRGGLDINKLRGHCFDGAANMSGKFLGVQKHLSDLQPKSPYVHCANHSLDLVLQEIGRKNDMICDALGTVKTISNIILESSKRRNIYANIVLDPSPESDASTSTSPAIKQVLSICPTRWTVRAKAIARFLENYERITKTLESLLEDRNSLSDEKRPVVQGFRKNLQKFETLFGIMTAEEIFEPCESLAKYLQTPTFLLADVKKTANILKESLMAKRTAEHFTFLYKKCEDLCKKLNMPSPKTLRQKTVPKRYEHKPNSASSAILTPQQVLRQHYYEVLDRITNEIDRRFNQEDWSKIINLEQLLLNSLNIQSKSKPLSEADILDTLGIYAEDFDVTLLKSQLMLLPSITKEQKPDDKTNEDKKKEMSMFIEEFQKNPELMEKVFSEVVKLVKLLQTIPATAATAERSFSALKRVKTYLRSTMTQQRLTHLLLLHVHSSETKNLNLIHIADEFIMRNAERKKVFGITSKPTV